MGNAEGEFYYYEERRPYTSKISFTRLWKCDFEGDDEGDYATRSTMPKTCRCT
jgi:hypothetical protein